ncbi:MAG: hypothetical protein AAF223_20420, partial [Bacteroidota bacterium]
MKTSLFQLLLLLLFPVISYSQGVPVMDIAHIAMTVANGATLDKQLDKLEEQVALSFQIEQTVSDIYTLQDEYQQFLRQAESVQDLSWANLIESQTHALSLEPRMDAYVPAYENIETLKAAYQTLEGVGGALALYQ